MSLRKLTAILMIVVTASVIGYDIWAAIVGGGEATISNVFISFSWQHATLPWAWGILAGHLTWPVKADMERFERFLRLGAMALATLTLLILDIQGIIPRMVPIIPMACGVCAGHFGWPQRATEEKV
jgi:hypothetical protein